MTRTPQELAQTVERAMGAAAGSSPLVDPFIYAARYALTDLVALAEAGEQMTTCPRCGGSTDEEDLTYSGCLRCQLERAQDELAEAREAGERAQEALRLFPPPTAMLTEGSSVDGMLRFRFGSYLSPAIRVGRYEGKAIAAAVNAWLSLPALGEGS